MEWEHLLAGLIQHSDGDPIMATSIDVEAELDEVDTWVRSGGSLDTWPSHIHDQARKS